MTEDIQIVPVQTPAELDRFIRLPARVHAGDRHFVTPLMMERREAFSPRKNPFFAHADTQFWLAVRGGVDVGRISAQVDRLVQDPAVGHFGMICAEDDPDVFAVLFQAAERWLAARGKSRVLGPFNLSINEETGLLVDGFDTPPMMLMGHDAPYIGARVEALGYAKAKDMIAYLYDIEHEMPAAARRMIGPRKPAALTVRNLDTSRYLEEFDTVTAIFNDAWSQNWGFIPFTPAEIAHMARSLKMFIDPKCVAIVELRGKAVGFGIALPNLNEMIADFGGSLFPFNWAKLMLRLKRGTRTARVPLMGISRSISGELAGAIAPFLAIDTMRRGLRAKGVQKVELSWILEDNRPMRHIIESLGADPYKTYRVYEKRLEPGPARSGMQGLTALVLAGTRPGGDPLAGYAGVSHKALIEIGGSTMIERVVAALAGVPEVARIVIAIDAPERLAGLAGLQPGACGKPLATMPTASGPSATVAAALAREATPLLVTTADHALLQPQWVREFLAACPADADVVAALAPRAAVEAAAPGTARTWLRFSDGDFSGCNLFLLARPQAAGAVALWQELESARKEPLRLMQRLGWSFAVRYRLGRLSSAAAAARLGELSGAVQVALVSLRDGRAAIDIDKAADLELVRTMVAAG